MLQEKLKKAQLEFQELAKTNSVFEISNRKFFVLTVAWGSFAFFVSFVVLVGSNPLKLFVPFSLYDSIHWDSREEFKIYISDGLYDVREVKRKILFSGNDREKVKTLIHEVGSPPFLEDTLGLQNAKKLPNLRNALLGIWFLDNGKRLVIDWNLREVDLELARFRSIGYFRADDDADEEDDIKTNEKTSYYDRESKEEREKRERDIEERKRKILFSVFTTIEKTLFANLPITTLEFRLNGKKKPYPNLEYDLTATKTR